MVASGFLIGGDGEHGVRGAIIERGDLGGAKTPRGYLQMDALSCAAGLDFDAPCTRWLILLRAGQTVATTTASAMQLRPRAAALGDH
jgi:hypothetical protein